MKIEVRLRGRGRIGNRLADAVKAQSDMLLLPSSEPAFGEPNSPDQSVISACNVRSNGAASVWVDVAQSSARIAQDCGSLDARDEQGFAVFTSLTRESMGNGNGGLLVPSADSLALARLVGAVSNLSPIQRLYSTVVRRAAHAADAATSSLDALQPVFDERSLQEELTSTLAQCVPICQIRRVIASYTHSHLHMVKLDLVDSIDRESLVAVLQADSRILVAAANDGFASTADIQEFFRDLGRPRGDRWESFVWEESIMVEDKCVYLMQGISPDAISVPEAIDAIRLIATPQLSLVENRRMTDRHLGMLPTLTKN